MVNIVCYMQIAGAESSMERPMPDQDTQGGVPMDFGYSHDIVGSKLGSDIATTTAQLWKTGVFSDFVLKLKSG